MPRTLESEFNVLLESMRRSAEPDKTDMLRDHKTIGAWKALFMAGAQSAIKIIGESVARSDIPEEMIINFLFTTSQTEKEIRSCIGFLREQAKDFVVDPANRKQSKN